MCNPMNKFTILYKVYLKANMKILSNKSNRFYTKYKISK